MLEAGEHKTSLAIPLLNNTDTELSTAEAELWWPKFILYMVPTQDRRNRLYRRYKSIDIRKRNKTRQTTDMWNRTKGSTLDEKKTIQRTDRNDEHQKIGIPLQKPLHEIYNTTDRFL